MTDSTWLSRIDRSFLTTGLIWCIAGLTLALALTIELVGYSGSASLIEMLDKEQPEWVLRTFKQLGYDSVSDAIWKVKLVMLPNHIMVLLLAVGCVGAFARRCAGWCIVEGFWISLALLMLLLAAAKAGIFSVFPGLVLELSGESPAQTLSLLISCAPIPLLLLPAVLRHFQIDRVLAAMLGAFCFAIVFMGLQLTFLHSVDEFSYWGKVLMAAKP